MQRFPFFARALRVVFFGLMESQWLMFIMNGLGAKLRKSAEDASKAYIVDKAPEKYRDILVPDYGIGCKVSITIPPSLHAGLNEFNKIHSYRDAYTMRTVPISKLFIQRTSV